MRKKKVKLKGTPCPHCGAIYQYGDEQMEDDGTVSCQNCSKSFKL